MVVFVRYDNKLLPYVTSAVMFHITRGYMRRMPCYVWVLLLSSARCHAARLPSFKQEATATAALHAARPQHQGDNIKRPPSLVTCFIPNPPFSSLPECC